MDYNCIRCNKILSNVKEMRLFHIDKKNFQSYCSKCIEYFVKCDKTDNMKYYVADNINELENIIIIN